MTTQDRINEDIVQQEYINQWRIKKAVKRDNRKYYRANMKHNIRMAWFSFKRYVKG